MARQRCESPCVPTCMIAYCLCFLFFCLAECIHYLSTRSQSPTLSPPPPCARLSHGDIWRFRGAVPTGIGGPRHPAERISAVSSGRGHLPPGLAYSSLRRAQRDRQAIEGCKSRYIYIYIYVSAACRLRCLRRDITMLPSVYRVTFRLWCRYTRALCGVFYFFVTGGKAHESVIAPEVRYEAEKRKSASCGCLLF